jgi:DNA-binding transcriptional regulator YhcF (GntR family)
MENYQRKSKIIDNSGDRRYFTMIPNYIVNHSSVYEQALYLVMKRIAGEEGTCWASPITIGKMMHISPNTVRKNLEKLIQRGWIKVIGYKGKTKPTKEYEIVDLWKFNVNYYSKKDNSTGEQSAKESSFCEKKVHPLNLVSSPCGNKEESIKEKFKKKSVSSFDKVVDYEKGKRWGEKPYYRNFEMRWSKNRWWVIPDDGGGWLEYVGKRSEIEWK